MLTYVAPIRHQMRVRQPLFEHSSLYSEAAPDTRSQATIRRLLHAECYTAMGYSLGI